MWLRRSQYEHLMRALSDTRAQVVQVERANATLQAHLTWLTAHVNRLEAERSVLTAARLGLRYPGTPEIEFEATPIRTERPDVASATPTRPVDDTERGLPADSIALAQAMGTMMEDVGDAAAAVMGLGLHPDGTLKFTK